MKKLPTPYLVRSLLIHFLDEQGKVVEKKKTTFSIPPMFTRPSNAFYTLEDQIKEAIKPSDKRQKLITISTNKGSFQKFIRNN